MGHDSRSSPRRSKALFGLGLVAAGACAPVEATAPLELHVDATTLGEDALSEGARAAEHGQLRGAVELRIQAPGCETLVLRAPEDGGDSDLLGIPSESVAWGPDRALVLGQVHLGGGTSQSSALLIGRDGTRLVLLDEMRAIGSAFLVPWFVERGGPQPELLLSACEGEACVHHAFVDPTTIDTAHWSIDGVEFARRHMGSRELRGITVDSGRFEWVRDD